MNGVARLIWAYGDSLNDEIFKNKLSQISVREIIRTAKERRAGSLGYAEAMLNAYNRRLKSGLKWSLLHSSKIGQAKRMEFENFSEPDTGPADDNDSGPEFEEDSKSATIKKPKTRAEQVAKKNKA